MSKYTIAMDMDGVLYPFDTAFNGLCSNYGGKPHDFTEWINFSEVFGDDLVDKVWNDPTLFTREEPYDGAVAMMQTLHEIPDVEVFIVTNPGRTINLTIPAKWAWVQTWFPWIDAYHFVTMHVKWYFKANLIVEDFPGNIEKWFKFNPTSEAIMISRRWNEDKQQKIKNAGGVVLDITDVVDYVRGSMD